MKSVKKTLKKYFIPHPENDHKPHFLREKSVMTTALVAAVLFLASVFGTNVVRTSPQLASIKAAFLVDLTNVDREKEGLQKLSINTNLVTAASMKADDMAKNSYFAHQSPDGRNPWDFIKAAGYQYVYAGENLAVNFDDSSEVERAWMDSPTHRRNIMNSKYTEIGIATAPGVYKGDKTVYVVQMFGRPRSTVQAVSSETPVGQPLLASVNTQIAQNIVPAGPERVEGAATEVPSVSTNSAEVVVPGEVPVAPEPEEAFIEFANPEATDTEIKDAEQPVPPESVPVYTTWLERLIVSPGPVVQDLYLVLLAIVVFSLILKIFVEIRLQHPKNIAYGLLLLLVIFGFMYMNTNLVGNTEVAMQDISE